MLQQWLQVDLREPSQCTAHTGGVVTYCGYDSKAGNHVVIRVSERTTMSYCHFRAMQTLLELRDHPCSNGGNDGIFGKGTKSALEAFQDRQQLDADAVCGPITWAELVTE
jgi:peptidoglycan hydrolase-like protein with peptidoglycan-binding domain